MHLKRKAYDRIVEWKERSKGRTALLIDGARRVGKSYLAEEIGRNEYRSFVKIDFARASPAVREMFDSDSSDLDMLFSKLSVLSGATLYRRESLIIFDEVQRFPRAREMIKFLVEDGRYDYIETGSLLSIKRNVRDILIPSEEEHMLLHPLDFEEFLWALGDDATAPLIRRCFERMEPLGEAVHKKAMNLFRQYVLVGGMPQAVSEYSESRDFASADRVKRMILELYRQDMSKFAEGYEAKVSAVFDQLPAQLSKREKRFNIASLSKSARTRTHEGAFMWLADGMMINQCFNAVDPTAGLSMHLDHASRKCYMADTGLLVTHALSDDDFSDNALYKSVLLDELNISEGMLMENAVAQMLRANGHRLFFYSRSDSADRSNDIEIDFLVRRGGEICPVEVKSGASTRHASLDKFVAKFGKRIGRPYVLCAKDLASGGGVARIPIYMAICL
ncbi:MAG: AAA family ATPase [Candidatus Methanoplasma sp.]|jgi:predicted AAA+ superfamily ATPase|nr:AAA family ATPase [Candidatus Methanoplasma sp.]